MIWTLQNITHAALAGILALALGAGAATAWAQAPAPRITMEQAVRIALDHVPDSTVESVERDVEGAVIVWEVEVRDTHGVEHEVIIDASSGRVIRVEIDD